MIIHLLLSVILVVNKNSCEGRTKDEWNQIAQLFHSINIQMRPVFREGNSTAGDLILKRMEETYQGIREFRFYLEPLDKYDFHKLLPVARFILLRGLKQFETIKYTKEELKEKYFWEKDKVKEFRSKYKDIKDAVAELQEHCELRHVNLDDD